MVGPILDDHAADGSPYARRCLILGLILAWLISPAYVTFRCEVLSEGKTVAHRRYYASLNTPFGARYFPTFDVDLGRGRGCGLNAPSGAWCFPTGGGLWCVWGAIVLSQCTFWCLVLSDADQALIVSTARESQCTFWCLVLSDTTSASPQ